MSRENVETMRQSLEALDRRDRPAWLAQCDQDFEVVASGAWPDAEVIRGPRLAWDFYVEVMEAFEDFVSADAELVDAGPTRSWRTLDTICAERQAAQVSSSTIGSW